MRDTLTRGLAQLGLSADAVPQLEAYAALLLDREEIDNRFIWHDAIKVIPVYIIVVYVIALGCSYILP